VPASSISISFADGSTQTGELRASVLLRVAPDTVEGALSENGVSEVQEVEPCGEQGGAGGQTLAAWYRSVPRLARPDSLSGVVEPRSWGLGNEQSIIVTLKEMFVDDAEANPVNELALLEDGAETAISRGWDGQTLRVYSRHWDADRFGQVIAALVRERGWLLQAEPTLLGA
jgi:hypothetical protein